jgi:very-short-patch-repair endonuclease
MAVKKTTCWFINKANKIHQNKYDYSKSSYFGANKKLIIICPKHGEFFQSPAGHLHNKHGCPKCSNVYVPTTKEFIKNMKILHNNKYDYSKCIYRGANSKIKIICPIHGEFEQRVNEHRIGCGCKKCSNCHNWNTNEYIENAKKIHGNEYDYSNTNYKNARTKIKIICKIHGVFEQRPNSHLNGCGCPTCKISHGENKILQFLIKNNFNYVTEKTFLKCKNPKTNTLLKYDFYIPSKNLLIEFDGAQHFHQTWLKKFTTSNADLKSIQYRDKIKTKFAKNNGIELLRIPYTKITSTEKILTDKLLCHSI